MALRRVADPGFASRRAEGRRRPSADHRHDGLRVSSSRRRPSSIALGLVVAGAFLASRADARAFSFGRAWDPKKKKPWGVLPGLPPAPGNNAQLFASRLRRFAKTTTFQGGVLFGAADTIAQTLQREGPFDTRRATSFAAFGAFYVGTVGTAWYRWIDTVAPSGTVKGLLTKVVTTWLVLGAAGNCVNMTYQRLAETRDFARAVEYTRTHVKEVILNDLKIWPAFDTFLFTVVPPPLRPTTLICVSLCWNSYVSMASHQQPAVASAAPPAPKL